MSKFKKQFSLQNKISFSSKIECKQENNDNSQWSIFQILYEKVSQQNTIKYTIKNNVLFVKRDEGLNKYFFFKKKTKELKIIEKKLIFNSLINKKEKET